MRCNAVPSPGRIFRHAHHGIVTLSCMILLVAVAAGCATVGPWQQEGKTERQLKEDEWYCAREVNYMDVWDRSKFFRLCMGARGWKEVGR